MAVKLKMIVKNVRSGSETSSWDEVINDGIQEKIEMIMIQTTEMCGEEAAQLSTDPC